MNNINILAGIARNNGLESSFTESYLYGYLKEQVEGLNTVEEQVIHGTVSIIPVHDITEAFSEYNFNTEILDESVIGNLKSKIRGKSIEAIEKDIKSFDDGIKKTKEELKELKSKTDDKSEKHKAKLNKQLTELTESRKGLVQALKQKKAKQAANESYAVTLDSLVEVSEALEITLEEAMNTIKEANKIEEDVVCVLPEGINEFFTVEEFCEFVEEMNEENIPLAWNTELVCEDFITEAGKLTALKDKFKEALRGNNPDKLRKRITAAEEHNARLKKELDSFNKLDSYEQKNYMIKKVAKELGTMWLISFGASAVVGGVGTAIVSKQAANMLLNGGPAIDLVKITKNMQLSAYAVSGGSNGLYLVSKQKKGKPIAFTPNMYKKAINNTINANNNTIKACKERIKELESKK